MTDFNLTVKSDSRGGLTIAIPRSSIYQGQLCGICGDFNGESKDDWIIGPHSACHTSTNVAGALVS